MITKDNFKQVLENLNFIKKDTVFIKKFIDFDCELKVDFKNEKLIFPEDKGLKVNNKTTSNFSSAENFVVFECVDKLLTQGYHPKHIELEKEYPLGHTGKSGRADLVISDNNNNTLLIIECKTAGSEYTKAINILENDSRNQLFSYLQQAPETKFLSLYASDFIDNKVISTYYLINVIDNKELLESDETLNSYKDASSTEDKWQVWCDTYDNDYAKIGIFEDNKPYEIGKTKFNLNDLQSINSKDIQGKYHEFATILRQHNVSGRENAFDKLVNLFLCKVTDEKKNPDELKFYYKGKAYDNPYDFQDRLQQLYKIGMDEFLQDEITYIANNQIDEAFEVFKDKPNATKDKIKEFVRELKFFTNNDFAFIDVHNKSLFEKNFEVLLKITKMIQDIKLTNSEENQFLGDMFESFLDQGVKQSEGQFFTPMPLVKFVINSMPKKDNSKVIDYACGAGHFLNEYASHNPTSKIVGVEKEYRLSKVAKVSSFMYGSEMDIIYSDALASHEDLKDDSYDVLVANPPYSVKGFLATLNKVDREKFELINFVDSKSYSKTGAIECFFIERAKQLLTKDAVAGIIVPSSMLNKDTPKLYTKTREIILKYFDIVAITEFGGGTFGKTGTNTVTLFLKRRSLISDIAVHFQNMVNTWFDYDLKTNEVFKHSDILEKYCLHIDIDFTIYKTLLCKELDDEIFKNELFAEYKIAYTKLNKQKKNKYTLVEYIREIEKDKLYYFALSSSQINDVIIVKSPTDNKSIKKFLGYEWGGRKGNEGIKYLTNTTITIDDDMDEDDKRVLENLQGLKDINTPLYNPKDSDDTSKINKIVKDNFDNIKVDIPKNIESYVSRSSLVDMLDFSRVDFKKAISLTPAKRIEIESKYSLIKLNDISEISKGKVITEKETVKGNIKVVAGGMDFAYYHNKSNRPKNIITISASGANAGFVNFWNEEVYASDCTSIIIKDLTTTLYTYNLLKINQNMLFDLARGSAQPHVYPDDIKSFKIPLPPLDIQKQIVNECQKIDDKVLKANETIDKSQKEIIEDINSSKNNEIVKLGDITENLSNLRVPVVQNKRIHGEYPYYGASGIVDYVNDYIIDDFVLLISEDGANLKTRNLPIAFTVEGKAWVNNHAHILKFRNKYTHKFVETYLNQLDLTIYITGQAQPKLNQKNLKEIKVKLPSLEIQKEIVLKIQKLEDKITKAQKVIDGAKVLKEEILRKYL